MKWIEPKSGDIKTKRKFALLPITIGKETRWLEWVVVQYRFSDFDLHSDPVTHRVYRYYGWMEEKFIDK